VFDLVTNIHSCEAEINFYQKFAWRIEEEEYYSSIM
jgi:hypothetical protein